MTYEAKICFIVSRIVVELVENPDRKRFAYKIDLLLPFWMASEKGRKEEKKINNYSKVSKEYLCKRTPTFSFMNHYEKDF